MFSSPIYYIFFKAMIGIFENEYNFMKGRTKGVLGFGSEVQEVEYMLIFISKS